MTDTAPAPEKNSPEYVARRWIGELDLWSRSVSEWNKQGDKIVSRYRDERPATEKGDQRFNVLWSNVQTLFPAIYSKPPKAMVERRFKDRDPVGRAASEILERCLDTEIETSGFHPTMKRAVLDRLLPGRGTVWVRYEPHIKTMAPEGSQEEEQAEEGPSADPYVDDDPLHSEGTQTDEGMAMAGGGEPEEYKDWECLKVDYVYWKDFSHNPARFWDEVRWVGRRVFLTREELIERFGEEIGSAVPLDHKPENMSEDKQAVPEYQDMMKAVVWEIWNKPDRTVYWVAPSYTYSPLDVKEDPLKLENFFPTPKPLFATLTNASLIPIPDYVEYQDQARELDDLTGRIGKIVSAIKVAGTYNGKYKEIGRIFDEGVENQLIPVESWNEFSGQKGLEGNLDFVPIDALIKTVAQLYEARESAKQVMYEITGISDIIRGQTAPSETATAQQIKGQFATLRLNDSQSEVARFCRDTLRIMAEIIAEHYSPETMITMSNYMGETDANPQVAMMAIELLRSDKQRGFRIDIETDSTISADDNAEKQARVEFLQAVGGFLAQALQAPPTLAPMLGQMLMFGVRGFKAGRELEAAIEQAIQTMQAQPPQGDGKAQADQQALANERDARMAEIQQRPQIEAMKAQVQAQTDTRSAIIDALTKIEVARIQAGQTAGSEQFQAMLDHMLGIREQNMNAATAQQQPQQQQVMQ